jgi:hypothetical protein
MVGDDAPHIGQSDAGALEFIGIVEEFFSIQAAGLKKSNGFAIQWCTPRCRILN